MAPLLEKFYAKAADQAAAVSALYSACLEAADSVGGIAYVAHINISHKLIVEIRKDPESIENNPGPSFPRGIWDEKDGLICLDNRHTVVSIGAPGEPGSDLVRKLLEEKGFSLIEPKEEEKS